MKMNNSIAVLLTCYNRKETTIKCLVKLKEFNILFDIYLVDDNSSDGTFESVKEKFPNIRIIKGNGDLFWNRGMYLAWSEAEKKEYDFYIWLNDDVLLYENCFIELFECSESQQNKSIISGIIENKDKTETLYGGYDKEKRLLKANGLCQQIQFLNGNVVLVPRFVYNMIGKLDPYYHHDLGDVDYGLRAIKKSIPLLTTRIGVGAGLENSICRERKFGVGLKRRMQVLYSPLGSNPRINFHFRRKHFGIFHAIGYFIFQHILNIISDYFAEALFGKKYT